MVTKEGARLFLQVRMSGLSRNHWDKLASMQNFFILYFMLFLMNAGQKISGLMEILPCLRPMFPVHRVSSTYLRGNQMTGVYMIRKLVRNVLMNCL